MMTVTTVLYFYLLLSGGGGPIGPNVVCQLVLQVQIGVRLRRTYVLQHILFLKSNVFLQTPDPRAGVHIHRSYEIPEQQRTSSW